MFKGIPITWRCLPREWLIPSVHARRLSAPAVASTETSDASLPPPSFHPLSSSSQRPLSQSKPPEKDTYLLDRGWMPSIRLDAQHHVTRKRIGWILHPSITSTLPSQTDLKIADLATGTGIIALEFHDIFPNASITALDISSAQFPALWTIPNEIKFDLYNFFSPPPAEYINAFDVINLRFIVNSFQSGGHETVVRNIHSMLKPGGYFQWHEAKPPLWLPVDPETLTFSPEVCRSQQMLEETAQWFSTTTFLNHLDDTVRDGGFEDVRLYDTPIRKEVLSEETRAIMWSSAEALEISLKAKQKQTGREVSEEEMDRAKEAIREFEDGVMRGGKLYAYHTNTVVARKPIRGG